MRDNTDMRVEAAIAGRSARSQAATVVELEEAVGHPGDVVGGAAPGTEQLGPAAESTGELFGAGAVPIEQLPQPLLGREPDGEDALAAVDPSEQKSLELALAGGDVGRGGNDPPGVGAGTIEEGSADIFRGANGEGVDRSPGPGDEPGNLEVDQLEEDGPAQIDADEPAVA